MFHEYSVVEPIYYNVSMTATLTATYDGRALVPAEPLNLPKGTTVRLRMETADSGAELGGTLSDKLMTFSGIMEGFPADFAKNHDHYLHGTPRRP